MTVLLDTHAFLWWVTDAPRLSRRARKVIADSRCLGRLDAPRPLDRFFQQQLEVNGFELLPIALEHAAAVRELPFHHRDPFDRLIATQARAEEIPLVSIDPVFTKYGVKRIW